MPGVPAAPPVRFRRSPKWIAVGIIALCLGGLASLFVYHDVSQAQTVVVVARTVHRGAVIRAGDLTTATVGNTPGVRTVSADQLSVLVGQHATVDLMAGSLLSAGAVGSVTVPAANHSVIGIRLVSGRAPVGHLPSSGPVRLVALPPGGADPSFRDSYTNMIIKAKVIDTTDGPDGLSIVLNVELPEGQASAAALLAAQERLVVVRDSEG
ncbi:hypothetical protein JOE57_001802 [Microlunatus panaciterrae]|uniref:SAF domain-containing protein n=1 Tax=Microlunatus panaciterrae TaxID=400768 RepID=A0ABS2RIQ9_9ACTN|nr:hypothetical protein [Microlunatus panaciterrae]